MQKPSPHFCVQYTIRWGDSRRESKVIFKRVGLATYQYCAVLALHTGMYLRCAGTQKYLVVCSKVKTKIRGHSRRGPPPRLFVPTAACCSRTEDFATRSISSTNAPRAHALRPSTATPTRCLRLRYGRPRHAQVQDEAGSGRAQGREVDAAFSAHVRGRRVTRSRLSFSDSSPAGARVRISPPPVESSPPRSSRAAAPRNRTAYSVQRTVPPHPCFGPPRASTSMAARMSSGTLVHA